MIERKEYDIIEQVRKDLCEFFSGKPGGQIFTEPLWMLTHKREYLSKELQDELDKDQKDHYRLSA